MCYNTYRGKEDFAYEKYLNNISGDRYLTSISVISIIDRAHNIYRSSQRWLDFLVFEVGQKCPKNET